MAQIETQKTNERPNLDPESVLIRDRAEDTRQILSIPNDDSWGKLMERVTAPIATPDTSSVRNPVARAELDARYSILRTLRTDTYEVLAAALSHVDSGKELTTEERSTILRFVGRYVDESDVYGYMHKGIDPSGTPLPPYLAEFVDSREAERFISDKTAYLLPLQFDVRDKAGIPKDVYPSTITPNAQGIMNAFIRLRVRMDRVSACATPDGFPVTADAPFIALLQSANFRPNEGAGYSTETIQATRLLVGYMMKYKKEIQKYADIRTKGDINAVLISEALDCAAEGSIAGQLMEKISEDSKNLLTGLLKGDMPEMRSLVKKAFEGKEIIPARSAEVLLAPLSTLNKDASLNSEEARALFQRDAAVVVEFFYRHDTDSVLQIPGDLGGRNDSQVQMITGIIDRVTGPAHADKTVESLRKAALLPDAKDPIMAKLSEIIKKGELKGRACFDLYYLLNAKGGNFLLAYKMIDILQSEGEPGLAKDLQIHLFKTFRNIAVSGAGRIPELATEFNLSDEQAVELRNMQLRLDELGVNMFYTICSTYYKMLVAFPFMVGLFSVAAMKTPGKLALKGYYSLDLMRMQAYAKMGYNQAKIEFGLADNITRDMFERSQKHVDSMLRDYNLVFKRLHIPIVTPSRMLGEVRTIMGSVPTGDLTEIAKAYKNRYPHPADALHELRFMTESDQQLRTALEGAGYDPVEVDNAIRAAVAADTAEQSQSAVNQNVVRPSPSLVAQPAPNQNAPARTVPAPPPAPKPAVPPSAAPAAAPSQGPATSPSNSLPKPPPPPAAPKRRALFNPNRPGNAPVTKSDLTLTQQVPLAEVQKIAAEAGITVEGKSEAELRAEVSAKVKGRK